MVEASMQGEVGDAPEPIDWRCLGKGLWAGRRDDHGVGTIEHLGRYVWVDADGVPHRGRRTLQEAQDDARCGAEPDGSRSWRCLPVTAAVVLALLLLVGTVLLVGWQLLHP